MVFKRTKKETILFTFKKVFIILPVTERFGEKTPVSKRHTTWICII